MQGQQSKGPLNQQPGQIKDADQEIRKCMEGCLFLKPQPVALSGCETAAASALARQVRCHRFDTDPDKCKVVLAAHL